MRHLPVELAWIFNDLRINFKQYDDLSCLFKDIWENCWIEPFEFSIVERKSRNVEEIRLNMH